MGRLKGRPIARVSFGPGLRTACWLIVFFICWSGCRTALAARYIDYLYVEANEGDSSGGHAAIRFDDQTFHFQHENPGIIRISRLDSAAFVHTYAMLGNRTIRASRIAVSDETYHLLHDNFVHLLLIQDAQLDIRDALHRDRILFEMLLRQLQSGKRGATENSLPLKGLGYFLPDGPFPRENSPDSNTDANFEAPHSPILLSLRESIKAEYGERFMEERTTRTETLLRELGLRAAEQPVPGVSRDIYPNFALSASARYEDAILALFALQVLQGAPMLRPGSFWAPTSETFRLTPGETDTLKTFAGQLAGDLVRLVNSSRNDWGFPFIMGMARLAAIEASLSSGRIVLLDVYPPESRGQGRDAHMKSRYLHAMRSEMQEAFLQRRREFAGNAELRESDYTALERVGNQLLELDRAIASGASPRRYPETPFPSRTALRSDLVLPDMDETSLKRELEAARIAEGDYARNLSSIYSYDLVRRNCVTEIFASISSAFGYLARANGQIVKDPLAMSSEESVTRLGGYMEPSRGLTFIPFVSAAEVDGCYNVVERHEQLSYRAERLVEMKKHESPLLVFLRESNTFTSTIYRPTPDDSLFLFFTDDTILFRPLFGAFNLAVGLGESLLGLVTMPVEGPKRLLSGVRGTLFSLPELVFINLRKGSMEYVEKSKADPDSGPRL